MLPIRVALSGGTGNAWANPPPAETPRRLLLSGGFRVDGSRDRRLEERARVLGFEDLRGYLQARCDAGYSIPRIGSELRVSDWQVRAALARSGVRLAAPPAATDAAATAPHRGADRRPRGHAGLRRGAGLPGRPGRGAGLAAGRCGRRARRTPGDGAAAAGPLWDPPGAAHPRGAGGGRGGASHADSGVAGAAGGAPGGARLPGSHRLSAGTPCGAGVVGEADAGRASGRPPVAGWGSWSGWGCCDPDLVLFSALLPDSPVRTWTGGSNRWEWGAPGTPTRELTVDGRVEAVVDPHVRARFLIG
jgi:hypothetical protein